MKNLILKILFVIGIIAILVLFAVAIVRIVPNIVASLGSDNDTSSETPSEETVTPQNDLSVFTLQIDSEESISGEDLEVTWTESSELASKEGMYAFTYSCVNDLNLEIIGQNGAERTLICNTPFTLGTDPVDITLRPTLDEGVTERDVALAILFYEPNVALPTGTAKQTVTVSNNSPEGELASSVLTTDFTELNAETGTEPSEPETPSTPTTQTPEVSTPLPPATPADLTVSTPQVTGNQITFLVTNIGGVPSGAFTVNYTLPGETTPEVSPLQPSLNPGERLGFTITITQTIPGGVLTIRANADNRINESDFQNNVVAVNLGFIPGLPGTPLPGPGTDISVSNLRTDKTVYSSQESLNLTFDVTNTTETTSAFTLEIAAPTTNVSVTPSGDGLCALRANKLICAVTSMSPRERRSYSFSINNLQPGMNQLVSVIVDTQGVVTETNELNNQATTPVSIY